MANNPEAPATTATKDLCSLICCCCTTDDTSESATQDVKNLFRMSTKKNKGQVIDFICVSIP